ncbi:M42 family metallopeptidase [Budviciaceae bacterium BWR-B9]|uniref:M42 family metallopeptidase n=1 Tax=Limnobaculum allomyrinae TaxID=2791986 RepID=A0ABS1ILE1_9GAMM|nr:MULTISPECIES: M42 family metallopeptidase [Limnobaculum]MBK5142559.1 M42 family metallopeptidase [Limnobaculum allomyrinae]MBV7690556.1 M42 family metallopeptidase [Limnobaculum sp. M2-1]
MTFDVQKNLLSLLALDGISGHEHKIAAVMQQQFSQSAYQVWQDRLGNVVAQYGSQAPDAFRLMIFAHMDEVGFMVRKIEENGFLRFERVGGPAQITMSGSTVRLEGEHGPIQGCIGIKSYHFSKGDERTQAPGIEHLWIDIGAADKQDAARMGIKVGTPVCLYNPPQLLANDLVCSKALDDRLGCTALLGVAAAVESMDLDIALYLVASVQEEFNIRGILPVLRRINPDMAIGIDITPSCDTPDLSDYSDVVINKGPGITCLNYHGRGTLAGLITPPKLIAFLEKTAAEHQIPVQREVAPGVITETGYIQMEQDGIPCASLSIPCRYTHSPSEVASVRDLSDCIRLLTAIARVKGQQFPVTSRQAQAPDNSLL